MSNSDTTVEPTVLTREYDAPRQLVFDAWTKVEHLCNWQFPFKGFTCEFAHADIVPGGSSLHKMKSPDGFEMWLLTRYEEIVSPEKIVFLQNNANAAGDILPNPQIPNWPKNLRTIVNLTETDTGKTKLELIWQPVDPTAQEIAAFEASRPDHGKGWGAGLEQLNNYLADLN